MRVRLADGDVVIISYLTIKELSQKIGIDYYLVYSFKNKQLEVRRRN